MGSLFGALLNSANALQIYGRVFSVIQNNVTNANTPGYVKQDQSLVAMPFNPAANLDGGVQAGPVLSSRDEYLEQAVRNQQELLGSAQQKASDLAQVQPLFDTSGNSGVPNALNEFFNNFSQLSVNPSSQVSRQNVIDAAGQVAQAFNQNAAGIAQVTANVVNQTRAAVTTINQIAAQVAEINQRFRNNSGSTQDAGLDAQLHAALENLSQAANYTLIKTQDGTYSVYLGGQTPVVIGDQSLPITADFSTPQTIIRDAQGNDITAQLDNTGGSLGALIEEHNTTLPGYKTTLDTLAKSFADTVNTTLSLGVDNSGNPPAVNLFTYNAVAGAAYTLAVTNITPNDIAAALPAAPGGNGNAIAMAQLANAPVAGGFTFTEAYGNLGGQVGRDVANAQQNQTVQQNLVTQAQQQRASSTGVSLDEEAAKLLQFQQAYQAVGKLVSVLDGLTQTVIDMVK
ncbi:MAG TPA: flagellar hook-associated protein FlgK [Chloroflexota bacterium]|nr:flagellar hook-associated protein FlgK [Chloroflexota bacterium]